MAFCPSKVVGDALFLPIAKAHGFRAGTATQFGGQLDFITRFAAVFGLSQRTLGGGRQSRLRVLSSFGLGVWFWGFGSHTN